MRRKLLLSIFIMLNFCLVGQVSYEYQYWFDSDTTISYSEESASNIWQKSVDLSHLDEGVHSIHVQVKDTSEKWSSPLTKYFMKLSSKSPMKYYYWFDEDNKTISGGEFANGIMMLDLNSVSDGLHYLNLQVEQNKQFSDVKRSMFYKVPQTEGIDSLMSVVLLNQQIFKKEKVATQNGLIHWDLDVSELSHGLHTLQFLFVTPSGAATDLVQRFFFKTMQDNDLESMKFYYKIDDEEVLSSEGTSINNAFHFDVDVSSISDGLHRITYFMGSDKLGNSNSKSSFFYKIPLGGNGIKEYHYWFNENEENKMIEAIIYTLTSIDGIDKVIIKVCGDGLVKEIDSKINLESNDSYDYLNRIINKDIRENIEEFLAFVSERNDCIKCHIK